MYAHILDTPAAFPNLWMQMKKWEVTDKSAALQESREQLKNVRSMQKARFSFVFIAGLICVGFCPSSITRHKPGNETEAFNLARRCFAYIPTVTSRWYYSSYYLKLRDLRKTPLKRNTDCGTDSHPDSLNSVRPLPALQCNQYNSLSSCAQLPSNEKICQSNRIKHRLEIQEASRKGCLKSTFNCLEGLDFS